MKYCFFIYGHKMCINGVMCTILCLFLTIVKLTIPYKTSYFPQHCLYFLPLPQGQELLVFIVLCVFIILSLSSLFIGQSHIYIYCIMCIYVIIKYSNSDVISLSKSSFTLSGANYLNCLCDYNIYSKKSELCDLSIRISILIITYFYYFV